MMNPDQCAPHLAGVDYLIMATPQMFWCTSIYPSYLSMCMLCDIYIYIFIHLYDISTSRAFISPSVPSAHFVTAAWVVEPLLEKRISALVISIRPVATPAFVEGTLVVLSSASRTANTSWLESPASALSVARLFIRLSSPECQPTKTGSTMFSLNTETLFCVPGHKGNCA